MKVDVVTKNEHKNGTSAFLTDPFIREAAEADHEVYRYDATFDEIRPCIVCDRCYQTGKCVYGGIYETLIPHLRDADVLALVASIYYFGMTAVLKAVINRFHQMGGFSHGNRKPTLMATARDSEKDAMKPLKAHYRAITNLSWLDGRRNGTGAWSENPEHD